MKMHENYTETQFKDIGLIRVSKTIEFNDKTVKIALCTN